MKSAASGLALAGLLLVALLGCQAAGHPRAASDRLQRIDGLTLRGSGRITSLSLLDLGADSLGLAWTTLREESSTVVEQACFALGNVRTRRWSNKAPMDSADAQGVQLMRGGDGAMFALVSLSMRLYAIPSAGPAEFRGSLALAGPDRLASPVGELAPDGTIWTAYSIRPAPFELHSSLPLLVAHWSASGTLLDSVTVGSFERSHSAGADLSLAVQGNTTRLVIARAGGYFTRLESTNGREWRPFPVDSQAEVAGAPRAWLADIADLRHSKLLGIPVLLPSQTYRVGRVIIAREEDSAPGPAAVQQLEPAPEYSAAAIELAGHGSRVVVALASSGDAVRSHPDERERYAIELWQATPRP